MRTKENAGDKPMRDITAAFQGITIPLSELVDDLHRRGWTLQKLHIKDGNYVAIACNPHKETLEAAGRTEATAVGNVLVKVMRREHMRSSATKSKLGAWSVHPIEQQFSAIAMAYAQSPVYDPKAASAWMELGQDFTRRAQTIKAQISIEFTNDPVPYQSADDLREDVTRKRHVLVTRAYAHHPIWSEAQMLDYRLVVDVLGHTLGGADWGWHGTCLAFAQLAPLLSEAPQKALFTELLGQAAFGQFYRQWGPQKITFLDKEIEKLQKQENKPGHYPVHPSQSIVPMAVPRFGKVAAETLPQELRRWQELHEEQPYHGRVQHEWPDGWTIQHHDTLGSTSNVGRMMLNCWRAHPGMDGHVLVRDYDSEVPEYWALHDPHGLPRAAFHVEPGDNDEGDLPSVYGALGVRNQTVTPDMDSRIGEWAESVGLPYQRSPFALTRQASIVGQPKDPNADWQSGITPLPDNAYLWQRQNGVDPLDIQNVQESLRPLEPGLTNMHPQLAKQSVVNAMRSTLLGARQTPRGHAIHYQTVMHIPADVDDPMAYHDALEQGRENWNQTQGYAPESHKQYWPQEQQFQQWVKSLNPELDDAEVRRTAKRELLHMLAEEEERVLAQDPNEELPAEMVEHQAYEGMKNRLKALTKGNVDQKVDFGDTHLWHEATYHADMFPPYLHTRMRPMAQISRNANALSEAAREDLLEHKGHGHHFRSAVLSLGIPGVGPRQASLAWLYLAPQTSQLGIVNPEMTDLLGRQYDQMSNRDYFKHERELAAGRDAAGYGHTPLGAFTTGLWDQYAGGEGWHPDRSPFRAYAPTPHNQVDWNAQVPSMTGWTSPYWWESTQEARDGAAQDFDRTIGTQFPKDEVPFQKTATGFDPQMFEERNPYGDYDARPLWTRTHSDIPCPNCGDHLVFTETDQGPRLYCHDCGNQVPVPQDMPLDQRLDVVDATQPGAYGEGTFLPGYTPKWGSTGLSPWVLHPSTGERLTGPPGTSLMQHLKGTFGHQTVQDVWANDYQVGKT